MGQGRFVPRHQGVDIGFQPVHQMHIGNGTVLDDLGQASAQLARRQGVERVQVAHHQLRLVESADHVFAQGMVDAGFTADRRIHLRQQGGRHLHKGHAAHKAGRRKARHIAHHTTAQRKQHGFAIGTALQ